MKEEDISRKDAKTQRGDETVALGCDTTGEKKAMEQARNKMRRKARNKMRGKAQNKGKSVAVGCDNPGGGG